MAVAVCKQAGARRVIVTDVNKYRLGLAMECGADAAIDVTDGWGDVKRVAQTLGLVEGFDIGLEMSGNPRAMSLMVDGVRHGGKIAALGIPAKQMAVDMEAVVFKGLTIQGIYGRQVDETWHKMIGLLEQGLVDRIQPVLTHAVSADDYEKAFQIMRSGMAGKVVMQW
jgi:threonine 3-dehydrogenase